MLITVQIIILIINNNSNQNKHQKRESDLDELGSSAQSQNYISDWLQQNPPHDWDTQCCQLSQHTSLSVMSIYGIFGLVLLFGYVTAVAWVNHMVSHTAVVAEGFEPTTTSPTSRTFWEANTSDDR